jgi:hypothetical protein
LSIRIFIKVISEQAAFSTINGALEIRISAMLESTRRRSEMLQSPEARVHDLRGATPVLIHEQKVLADFIAARVNTKVHLNRMVQERSA